MASPAGPTNRDRAREQGKYRGNAGSRRPGDRTRSRSDSLTNPRYPITPGSLGAEDLERLGVTRNSGAGSRPGGADRPSSMPGPAGPADNRMGGFKSASRGTAGMQAGSHIPESYRQEQQSQGRTRAQSGTRGVDWSVGMTAQKKGPVSNSNPVSPQELMSKEESGSDQVGRGYSGDEDEKNEVNDLRDKIDKQKRKKGRVFRITKKRGIIFGSVFGVGAVGGLTLFTTTLAPLQAIHITETLSQHLDSQQDTDDESIVRIYRYIHYLNKGAPERARMTFLGNKFADAAEKRLNATGIRSMYTNVYGFINGYVIDTEHPEFKGKTEEQLKQYVKDKYGLDVVRGETLTSSPNAKGKLVIDVKHLGHFTKGRAFLSSRMRQSGLSKIVSVMAMRVAAARSGAKMHPMTLKGLDAKALRSLEDLFNKMRERRAGNIANGDTATPGTDSKTGGETEAERQAAQEAAEAKGEADKVVQEGKQAATDVKAGKPGALIQFQNSIHLKLIGGGAGAIAIPCLLRGIASSSSEIKKEQVALPAQRAAVMEISRGSQIESGMDFDSAQVGFIEPYLNGKDSRGVNSSFSDAQGWNALESSGALGSGVTGVAAMEGLRDFTKGTPFDFLNQGATGKTFDVLCSAPVTIGLTVVTFFGGPVTAAVGVAASLALIPQIEHQAASWLAGAAIDPEARGADLGNILAYGGRFAANELGLATGGNLLSKDEEKALTKVSEDGRRQDFTSKSLAYRLFNPRDYRTPVAKLIDRQATQNTAQNIATVVHGFTHLGNALSEQFGTLLSGKTHAMAPDFDWGFGKVGMSMAKLNDPRFNNPFESSERTANTLLEGPDAQKWIDRAAKCNAVTISKDSDGLWNATSTPDKTPTYAEMNSPECLDSGFEWTSIQWFIHYTVLMNGEACRLGDGTSCKDINFQNSSTSDAGGTPIAEGGDPRALARQLLTSPNVKFQQEPSQRQWLEQVANTGTQHACGKDVPVSPELLAVLAQAAQTYKIVIGVFVIGHDCDSGYHPRGMAVDLNGVAKGGVSTGNQLHFDALNAQTKALVTEFYNSLAQSFPENKGGLGQIQCFGQYGLPAPTQRPGVAYFNDACNHLHVDVRRNK